MSEKLETQPVSYASAGNGTDPLSSTAPADDEFSRTMVIDEGPVQAPQPDDRLQPGSVLRDRYLLQERIAAGSMGVVYRALDRHLGQEGSENARAATVALKVLTPELASNPDALRALQQEAAKGRCLSHPNIVRFIDLDREDDLYFLVMEWLEGRSLAEMLDAGQLPGGDVARALRIIRQVGDALEHAHRRGVVHADVKPGNIVVLPDGTVKLVDFGIARVRQQGRDPREPSVVRAATPAYSSMQVLTGEEPVPADDVWSLACLAYRLIAGHRVFGPRNAAEAAAAGMEPERPASLSDAQWKALRKGLAYARVARQQTPREFVEDLEGPNATTTDNGAAGAVTLEIPADDVMNRRFESRRSPWPWLLFLLVMAAGAGALVLRPDWRANAERAFAPLIERVKGIATSDSAAPPAGAAGEVDDAPSVAGQEAVPGDAVPADGARGDTVPPATGEESSPTVEARPSAARDVADDAPPRETPAPAAEAISNRDTSSASLVLAAPGADVPTLDLDLAEDGEPMVVELYRWFDVAEPLLVRVDEVGFSGNRSPGEAGAYRLSGDGVVSFDAGQRRATLTVTPARNEQREPDRQVSLALRDYYSAEAVLGEMELRLLDDDQRRFEAGIPGNTIAFTVERTLVRERDPAVQIDILRYNPGSESLSVPYTVTNVTAVEGEDYFVPSRRLVTFGPGQRNARLLIPLVQDNVAEDDETFRIELDPDVTSDATIARVTVTIRDDDALDE